MIQRIQTVLLFLAIIALVLFNIFPYWQVAVEEGGNPVLLMSYGLTGSGNGEAAITYGLYPLVAGLSGLAIIIALVEIFKYKNRITQMKLAIANSFLMTATLVLMTYFVMDLQKQQPGTFGVGFFIFALAMLLNILARRFIQKDEKLVRSVDRLR